MVALLHKRRRRGLKINTAEVGQDRDILADRLAQQGANSGSSATMRTWALVVAAIWHSPVEPIPAAGSFGPSSFERPGRVTVSLMRTAVDAPWIATRTHVSLKP
jgi:hypothetical protein